MEHDRRAFEAFRGSDAPILRLYSFERPTLTLGRLEALHLALEELDYPYEVRPTGGRAVYHSDEDLCYTVIASQRDPMIGGALLESYEKISLLLAAALRSLGRGVELSKAKHPGQGALHCFSAPSFAELTLNGKKVAGGAQARREDVFIQQGVLLLKVGDGWSRLAPGTEAPMAGLNDDPSLSPVTRDQLESAIVKAFRCAGIRFRSERATSLIT